MTLSTDFFGSNVTLDATDANDPILKIHLKDFKDIADGGDIASNVGLDTVITGTNFNASTYKIVAALLILWEQKQPIINDDDAVGIYVTGDSKSFVSRNGIDQIETTKFIGIYTPDTTGTFDPDSVGS
jgi:hypothetical protein